MENLLREFWKAGSIQNNQKEKKFSYFDPKTKIDEEIKGIRKGLYILLVIDVNFQIFRNNIYQVKIFPPKQGIKKIELKIMIPLQKIKSSSLKTLVFLISKLYGEFSSKAVVRIKGLPYCLFSEPEGLFLESKMGDFVKKKDCQFCKFNSSCAGLPALYNSEEDLGLLKPQFLPEEIAIEISDHKDSPLDTATIRSIMVDAKKMKVLIIRFVLLGSAARSDIYELLKYAKDNNFQVRLDISHIVITDFKLFVEKISDYVDYVVTYVNSSDLQTGRKKWEILLLKRMGIRSLRAVTIMTPDNLRDIDKIYHFILRCDIGRWAINRDMDNIGVNKAEIRNNIDKLFEIKQDAIRRGDRLKVHMVYPIPFCCHDPVKINFLCTGPKSVEGYERILIDLSGNIKPIHYFSKIIGNFRDIKGAWNQVFLKSIRDYSLLPPLCKKCFFLEKCKGGSRYCAFCAFGSYYATDPWMDYNNAKNYIC